MQVRIYKHEVEVLAFQQKRDGQTNIFNGRLFAKVKLGDTDKWDYLRAQSTVEQLAEYESFEKYIGLVNVTLVGDEDSIKCDGWFWLSARYSGEDPEIEFLDQPLGYDEWADSLRGL